MADWIDEVALDADDAAYLRRGAELVAAGAKPLDQVAQMQMRAYCIARDKWESKHKENEEMNEHELTVYERIADPLAAVCNDLALAIMLAGGLPISIPPQNSGRDPDPDKLAADWERWQASLARRESSGAPLVVQHPGRRY